MEPTALEEGRYSDPHRDRLEKGYNAFIKWTSDHDAGQQGNRDCPEWMNGALTLFIDHCHDGGGSFSLAEHAVLAAEESNTRMKKRLGRAWGALKARKVLLPRRNCTPIALEMLEAMQAACLAWALGDSAQAKYVIPLSVLLQLGFWGLLWPKELFGLRGLG